MEVKVARLAVFAKVVARVFDCGEAARLAVSFCKALVEVAREEGKI